MTEERDKLRHAYEQLKEHVELLRRRIFVAKAERIDVAQLELEFAQTKAKLDQLAKDLGEPEKPAAPPPPDKPRKPKPHGRRNLADEDMVEERIEILNPALEGKAIRVGFEESYRLAYRRAHAVRLVVARATYKEPSTGNEPAFQLSTVQKPKELVDRGLLAPSMIAHMLVQKYRFGIPFFRCRRGSRPRA